MTPGETVEIFNSSDFFVQVQRARIYGLGYMYDLKVWLKSSDIQMETHNIAEGLLGGPRLPG